MRNPPGYGCIVDLGKNRRRPIGVRVPNGTRLDKDGGEHVKYRYIGYFERTPKGKADAIQLLAAYNQGAIVADFSTAVTFKELADKWLETHLKKVEMRKGKVSKQTVDSYSAAIRKCKPIFDKPIDKIRPQDVQWIADAYAESSMSTVTNIKIVLNGTFDYARKKKLVSENFIDDIDFLYKKPQKSMHNTFSRDEVSLLWEHKEEADVQIVLIMVYTGLRIEELLSMRTENVHIDDRYMVGGVKTAAGINRSIPIAKKIDAFVRNLYDSNNEYLLMSKRSRYSRTVFVDSIWNPVMARLNIEHLPHDTRYTCITMLDRAGVNPNVIKKIVGHEGTSVTDKIYVQKDLKDLLAAIDAI